jgi:hypothetical protein
MNKLASQVMSRLRTVIDHLNKKFNSMSEFSKRTCVIVVGVLVAAGCVWITITSIVDYLK